MLQDEAERLTAGTAAKLVFEKRGGRMPMEECRREAELILSLVSWPGASLIRSVTIAGVVVPRLSTKRS